MEVIPVFQINKGKANMCLTLKGPTLFLFAGIDNLNSFCNFISEEQADVKWKLQKRKSACCGHIRLVINVDFSPVSESRD